MIYLDNAATTKPCAECVKAVNEAMENGFGNASSLHGLGGSSNSMIARARKTLLAAVTSTKKPFDGSVLFTSGATESNNTALLGSLHRFRPHGKKIVSTAIEHPSVAKTLTLFEEDGLNVVRLAPKDCDDFVEALVNEVDENTALLSAMAVNNETGFKIDVPRLYKEVKQKTRGLSFISTQYKGF